MNREEVLRRSRKENDLEDERVQYIGLKGANFSITILIILWIVLTNFAPLNDVAKYAMGLLVTATSLSNWAYQLVKCKTKTAILFTILFFVATAIYLVLFLKYGFNLF